LRSGLLTHKMLEDVPFLAGLIKQVKDKYPNLDESRLTHEVTRRQITQMVEDVIGTAQQNLAIIKPTSADDARNANQTIIGFSERMADIDKQLKAFLFANVYRHPTVMEKRDEVSKVVDQLFDVFMNNSDKMEGARWVEGLELLTESARARHVGDYLSGMTDTYALDVHQQLFGTS
jgi:dGTPase